MADYINGYNPYYIIINGYNLDINLNDPSIVYNVDTLNSDRFNTFLFSNLEDYSVKINGQKITMTETNIKIPTISVNDKIVVSIKQKGAAGVNGGYVDYLINTLPDDFPKYSIQGKSPYEGDYYFSSLVEAARYYLFKMNNDSDIVFYLGTAYSPGIFRKCCCGNKVRYIYTIWTTRPTITPNAIVTPTTGNVVLLDENYKEIDRVCCFLGEDEADAHDVVYVSDYHYYVNSYVPKTVYNLPPELGIPNNQSNVLAGYIVEIKNGKVTWVWDSTNFPELYVISVFPDDYENQNAFYADYSHVNSIFLDPCDGNLLVSFRSLNTLMKIDTKTGGILWLLGGTADQFGLTPEQQFSGQHDATYMKNGEILLFDNGVNNRLTRILKMRIDERRKKLLSYEAFQVDDRFSVIMGSAQALSIPKEAYLICWGGILIGDTTVNEYDFLNNVSLFEFTFLDKDPIFGPIMYRAYKYK